MARNQESILHSVKQFLDLDDSYTVYDSVLLGHINSGFNELWQLGVGDLNESFYVEDKDTIWEAFIGDHPNIQSVKTYMYFYVKLAFDPPPTGPAVAAMERHLEQIKWRLNITDPTYNPNPDLGGLIV